MKTILAPIDLSPVSDLVVAEAAELTRLVGGTLVLVTVLVEPIFLKEYAPPPKKVASITVEHERSVRKRLEAMRARLQAKSVPTEIVVRRGGAAAHILDEADRRDAAFIVIGSHGQGAFLDLILGSTTQRVLKGARRPVVVIPPKMRKAGRPRR
jgi:nucleotide-binding universal stress UspA family protein